MGVPRFFRWVADRYPEIISDIITDYNRLPPIDMLFLDMNGIIHYASHGNGSIPPDQQTMPLILKRIEEELLFLIEEIVRPNTMVYFAIDGVAPRAKLNQQRARRYRAAKERELAEADQRVPSLPSNSAIAPPPAPKAFDSNCITPGTSFMKTVSEHLLTFLHQQKEKSSYWNSLNLIFSGSEVPGEGEHKIISYIREMKEQHLLLPNSRYCLYGADADMIMLALATHEPYVIVLREITKITADNHHHNNNSNNNNNGKITPPPPPPPPAAAGAHREMQFIRVNVLREYLIREFSNDFLLNPNPHNPNNPNSFEELDWGDEEEEGDGDNKKKKKKKKKKKTGEPLTRSSSTGSEGGGGSGEEEEEVVPDYERWIDDFVFLTFFIGNDFLPHLPGLDIGDSAFDLLFDAYKTVFSSHPGRYVVKAGGGRGRSRLNYDRLELILQIVGASEAVIYEEKQIAESFKEKKKFKSFEIHSSSSPSPSSHSHSHGSPHHHDSHDHHEGGHHHDHQKREDNSIPENSDSSLGLGLSPRQGYYLAKFGFQPDDDTSSEGEEAMREVVKEYLQGLEWCLAYYSQGCISWDWFYPYHYGPFLQDMTRLKEVSSLISFNLSSPLQPFQQLLACLPPQSGDLLPPSLASLMSESSSPLLPYYPTSFISDLNGKKRDYEAVVLLPFIDILALKTVSEPLLEGESSSLTEEEKGRNSFGKVHYFMPYQSEEQLFDFKISPANGPFKAELIPGTVEAGLEGFPGLGEVVSMGKSIYFVHPSSSSSQRKSNRR